jgi:hypothetical protein
MRKLVVILVVLVAVFTFIRDYPAAAARPDNAKAEIRSVLMP